MRIHVTFKRCVRNVDFFILVSVEQTVQKRIARNTVFYLQVGVVVSHNADAADDAAHKVFAAHRTFVEELDGVADDVVGFTCTRAEVRAGGVGDIACDAAHKVFAVELSLVGHAVRTYRYGHAFISLSDAFNGRVFAKHAHDAAHKRRIALCVHVHARFGDCNVYVV